MAFTRLSRGIADRRSRFRPDMHGHAVDLESSASTSFDWFCSVADRPTVVTSGPGATNLITPLQDALMDGTPMIAFCGQVPTSDLGKDSFQEANVIGLAKACTKWCVQPQSVDDLPRCIDGAFEAATTGRPGPVLVDLPKDVTASILETLPTPRETRIEVEALLEPRELAIRLARAAKLINGAQKPVIYAGQGVFSHPDGPDLLRHLSETAQIPVTTTLLGLGAYDEEDPKSLHMLGKSMSQVYIAGLAHPFAASQILSNTTRCLRRVGMHGSCYANLAMQEADVILALGARFDDRVTRKLSGFAPAARKAASEGRGGIIHFEIWPHNMNKIIDATEMIPGDLVSNLRRFTSLVNQVPVRGGREAWLAQITQWKNQYPWAYEKEGDSGVVKPQSVISVLDELTAPVKEKTVIATGVGGHQMFAAQVSAFVTSCFSRMSRIR